MSIKKRKSVDAETGRELWTQLLERMADPNDRNIELFMRWITESVVVDMINVRIHDDAFAMSLGARIQKLLDAEEQRRTGGAPTNLTA